MARWWRAMPVLLGVVGLWLALLGAPGSAAPLGGRPGTAPPSRPSSLSLSLSRAHVGDIAAHISGPAGATVTLTGTATAAATVTLDGRGQRTIAALATWRCTPRLRTFTATLDAPAAATTSTPAPTGTPAGAPATATATATTTATATATATATITTPSCAHRYAWTLTPHPTTGTGIVLRVRDRWRLGASGLRICVTAPVGLPRCRGLTLGTAPTTSMIATPRPGDWQLTLGLPGRAAAAVGVWVTDPGGAPLRLLAAGDSEMEGVGNEIAATLARYGAVGTSDAKSSSGLENEWFFNWYHEAARIVAHEHPQVTVIFMGANAGFTIEHGATAVDCCSAAWSALYAKDVERLTRIFLQGQRGLVFWTTLPTPSSASFRMIFDAVNRAELTAARALPGRLGIIDANAVFTPHDVYRNTMTWGGSSFTIHQADGLHLSTPADGVYTQLVLDDLLAGRVIRRP